MRHIPEEELHAYLDQALSRSQCVEIESHLAACPACRRQRDSIAALRDRTTALLATLVPARDVTPPFELIRARRAASDARRRQLLRRAAWAASVVAALGAGWGLSQVADGGPAPRAIVAAPETPAPLTPAPQPGAPAADDSAIVTPAERALAAGGTSERLVPQSGGAAEAEPAQLARAESEAAPRDVRPGAGESPNAPRSLQVSSSTLPQELALDGLWRTLSWENAQVEAGGAPAHVDGLPVVGVQVQQASSGKPLMVVAQQLRSGEVIRTIEGPAADVSSLLRRNSRPGSSPWPAMEPGTDAALNATDGSFVTVQGDRILAISAPGLPSDSLAAIARRVHASRPR